MKWDVNQWLQKKTIYNKLQSLQSGNSSSSGNDQNNQQIVPIQQQMHMMQLEMNLKNAQMNLETAQKFAELEAKMKIQAIEAKHEREKAEMKHKADIDSVKKDLSHQEQIQTLKTEKVTAVYEGKLAVMEEQNKQKSVVVDSPPWWSASYGNWDPLYYDRYPAGSVLLTPHFFRTIQGWLGGPRHWDLRYRGTRDGFSATNFHSNCDNIGATVIIIRANGYLFGGYTPLSWNTTSGYLSNSNCFLFTLTNANGASPTHFYSKGTHSIYCATNYGPTFGGGHDLYICSNSHSCNSSYSNFPSYYNDSLGHGKTTFAGANNFTVSEIEVFRVG